MGISSTDLKTSAKEIVPEIEAKVKEEHQTL